MAGQPQLQQTLTKALKVVLENAYIAIEPIALYAKNSGAHELAKAAEDYRESFQVRIADSKSEDWNPSEHGIYETLEGLSLIARELWNPSHKDLAEWVTLKVVSDTGKALWYQKAFNDPKFGKYCENIDSIESLKDKLVEEFLNPNADSPVQRAATEKNKGIFEGVIAGIQQLKSIDPNSLKQVSNNQIALSDKLPSPEKVYDSAKDLVDGLVLLEELKASPPASHLIKLCQCANANSGEVADRTNELVQAWKKSAPLLPDAWVSKMSQTIAGMVMSTQFDTLNHSAAEIIIERFQPKPTPKSEPATLGSPESREEYRSRRESAESKLDTLIDASPGLKASLSQERYAMVRERLVRAMAAQKKGASAVESDSNEPRQQ